MSTEAYRTLIPLFEELRGERVLVRPYRESDAQALFEAVAESRDHLRPWLPFADTHQSAEESRDWIIHQVANWLLREDLIVSFVTCLYSHSSRLIDLKGLYLLPYFLLCRRVSCK